MKKKLLFFLFLSFFTFLHAADGFKINKIKVIGLQGISSDTVLSHVPYKSGDYVTEDQTNKVLIELYKTGLFSNVNVGRSGSDMIISVSQRPVISNINITGNKEIATKDLQNVLMTHGLRSGYIYDRAMLVRIRSSLIEEYKATGYYNASVIVDVKNQIRNRVSINIVIDEGFIAKVKDIKFVGNKAFGNSELLGQFNLSTSWLFSFITHANEYSELKLAKDLNNLNKFYLDNGYLRFAVVNKKVTFANNKSAVYITIYLHEGVQYYISGYNITGKTVIKKAKLLRLIDLKKNDIFSRKRIMQINKIITDNLAQKGYANADVRLSPVINDSNSTVFLTFSVVPGKRVYVRHVNFHGNYKTNDNVLRRALTQFEGALYVPSKIEESKQSLLTLPSQNIRNVEVKTKTVPGKKGQVDLDYSVTEMSSAELRGGIGYSQLDKFMANFSIAQKNFFGTGNSLSFGAMGSSSSRSANASYYNPDYSGTGIGRSFSAYGSQYDAGKNNLTDYSMDDYGAAVGYNFPLSLRSSFKFGFGLQDQKLHTSDSPAAQVKRFVDKHGSSFFQATVNAGWNYNNLDRALFPTRGFAQGATVFATVPVANNSLEYYTLGYNAKYYHTIYKGFIGFAQTRFGYGNGYGSYGGNLPFFENFYAGGFGSVRGYEGNSLGPRAEDDTDKSIGGNFSAYGSAALIFPNYISDNVRTSLFFDAGNVYDGVKLSNLRCSTGLEIDWFTPMGATFNFSFAKALNRKDGDKTEVFQFGMGVSI